MIGQLTEGPRSFHYENIKLKPKEQIGLHHHPQWELSCVMTGAGLRLIDDTTEPFHSGDVVLVPPEMPHCWYFDEQTTDSRGRIHNITVSFGEELPGNCAAAFPELAPGMVALNARRECAVSFTGGKAKEIKNLLLSMSHLDRAAQAASVPWLLLLISGSEEESVISRFRKTSREEERLSQAKTYITCNISREMSLQDVASHVGMNRSAFCVFFKKATGETFVSYLNRLRIETACRLMVSEKCLVAEACYKSGFNDVHYFNRVFKRIKGLSPTAWVSMQ